MGNLVNYITESKKNSLLDNIFIIIFFILPILFLSPALLNISLLLISFYFFYYIFKNKFFYWIKNGIIKIIFIFWIYLLLNTLLNFNSFLEVQKSFYYLRYIIFFICFVFLLPKLKVKFKNLFFVYLFITLIFCFDIFIQFIFTKNILGFDCQMSCQRNSSFFKDELIAGSFLLYIGIISTCYFYFSKNTKYLFPFLILIFISIIFTGDRTPFIMFFILIFNVILFKKEIRLKFLLGFIFFLIIFSSTLLISEKLYQRYISNTKNIFQSSEISIESISWWLDRLVNQEKFLIKILSDNNALTDHNAKIYEELEIYKIINSNKETLFLEEKNFYEIMGKRENIILIKKMVTKEIEPLIKKKKHLKKIILERAKNNTQNKWYNKFFDNPYGAHYLTAYGIFLDNPIFGTGIKSFREKCKDYDMINSILAPSRCSTHPHNMHLEILSEQGLIGYFLFILIFLFFLKTFYLGVKNSEIVYVIVFSLVICTFFPLRPSGSFFSTISSMYFWLSFSIFFLINELQKKQ